MDLTGDVSQRWGRASLIIMRKQSVKVVCPGIWTAVCVAVPLWHRMGGEKQVLSCHTACSMFLRRLTFYRIILRSTEALAEKKKWVQRQSFIGNGGHWRPLLTSLNWWKRLSVFEENNAQKVQSHMTMKEVKPYVTLPSFSVLVSEIEILLDDAL